MLFDFKTVPTRKELIVDLATFTATVVVAIVQGWKAADIVWASWIASLLIGLSFFLVLSLRNLSDYALARGESESDNWQKPMEGNPGCLFLSIGGLIALLAWFAGPGVVRTALSIVVILAFIAMVFSILAPRGWLGVSLKCPVVRAFVFLPTTLFIIFFFLVHFGGFHLGHAAFLSVFVPPEVGIEVTADAFIVDPLGVDSLVDIAEVPAHMGEALAELREALIEARGSFIAFLGFLILAYWPYIVSVAIKNFRAYRDALLSRSKKGEAMFLPYKNVIRVHLMIFALVPFAALGSGLLITIVVMSFYFFPVESVVAWARSR